MKVKAQGWSSVQLTTSSSEIPRHALCPDTPSRDARLLRCSETTMGSSKCRLNSLADAPELARLRVVPSNSSESVNSVNSFAMLSELVLASDGDASCISSTLSRVIHQPSRRWVSQMSRARTLIPRHKLFQPSTCTHPTSTCQHGVAIDHGETDEVPSLTLLTALSAIPFVSG